MMLALLIYSYATGTFSSRAMERQSYDSMAVRHLCANHHPDHDTIAKFRRENGPLLKACFVRVLELAREVGLLKLGTPQRGRNEDRGVGGEEAQCAPGTTPGADRGTAKAGR